MLTPEMIEEAANKIIQNFGQPDTILISPAAIEMIKEHEKWCNWVRHLPFKKRKQEVLKRLIRERRGQKFKNYRNIYEHLLR